MENAVRVLKVVFWIAAPVCAGAIAASTFTEGMGAWLSWTIGVSVLLVVASSGGILWVEFGRNPLAETERGEWTNSMLFFAIVFTIMLFMAVLYLPTLLF